MSHVCDGETQCPDSSDEWECFSLLNSEEAFTNSTEEADIESNATLKNILRARKHGNNWLSVCADQWLESYSDTLCQQLGYHGSAHTEYISELNKQNQYLKLELKNNQTTNESSLLLNLNAVADCPNKSILSIQCQEFSKFNKI